jgi:uncharacterized protein GlcG (DUF336 family)
MTKPAQLVPSLRLAQARGLATSVLEHGRQLDLPPLTVAVLDAGGVLITLDREDGSALLRPKMAMGKAYAALSIGMSSRAIAELTLVRPIFVGALAQMSETFTPSAGGLLIENDARQILGAIGVTGAAPDEDEACAIHALRLAGFVASSCSPDAK